MKVSLRILMCVLFPVKLEKKIYGYNTHMANPWIEHVKKYRRAHPNVPYNEALKKARASYKPVVKRKPLPKRPVKRKPAAKKACAGGKVRAGKGNRCVKKCTPAKPKRDAQGRCVSGKVRGRPVRSYGQYTGLASMFDTPRPVRRRLPAKQGPKRRRGRPRKACPPSRPVRNAKGRCVTGRGRGRPIRALPLAQ